LAQYSPETSADQLGELTVLCRHSWINCIGPQEENIRGKRKGREMGGWDEDEKEGRRKALPPQ